MLRMIVLDMAGTTVRDNDAVGACFRAALSAVDVQANFAEVNAVMGLPKPEAIRTLLRSANRPSDPAEVAAIHRDFVDRMLTYYRVDPEVAELPGAVAFFRNQRARGVKIALNTGFSRDIVEVILDRLGWRDEIDASIASDEVARGRPFPDMIESLRTRFGIADAQAVAKIGDTSVDLEEGMNAGCGWNLGITTGAFTRAQLAKYPHTHIIDSLAEADQALATGGS